MKIKIKYTFPVTAENCSGMTEAELENDPYWQLLKGVRAEYEVETEGGWLTYWFHRLVNGKHNVRRMPT